MKKPINLILGFESKSTDELLAILKCQGDTAYSGKVLDAVQQILLERGVVFPLASIPLTESTGNDSSRVWEPTVIQKRRKIYFNLCLLANLTYMTFALTNFTYTTLLIIILLMYFWALYLFLRVVRQVLSYSVFRCIVIAVVLLIPFFGLIPLAVIDWNVQVALKKAEAAGE